MTDSFDPYEFMAYLRVRWWYVALACALAGAVALLGSLLLPKRYSATASILIDPPAISDPRAAIAVSPVYLESLKTYEHFADNDSLFRRAVEEFHLKTDPNQSIEALKRRVLKVSKLRDTRILQISVSLPEPKQAAALAAYLARETVALSESAGRRAENDVVASSQAQLDAAEKSLAAVQRALDQEDRQEAIAAIKYDLESLMDMRTSVERDLLDARADLAERPDESLARRAAELQTQAIELDRRIRIKNESLAQRTVRRTALQLEFDAASRDLQASRERVRNLQGNAGLLGERLQVIDSGTVPQEPSFPKTPLIVTAAVMLALAVSLLSLAAGFSMKQRRSNGPETTGGAGA
ncbi:MAG: hypothetical protein IH602_11310 [Bryobacteraceae bacterium]|nr:hypothetical protein [Bryobacteraceae bacterium]